FLLPAAIVAGSIEGIARLSPLDIVSRLRGWRPRTHGMGGEVRIVGWRVGGIPSGGGRAAYVEDLTDAQNLLDWPLTWMPFAPGFSSCYGLEEKSIGKVMRERIESREVWRAANPGEALPSDSVIEVGTNRTPVRADVDV